MTIVCLRFSLTLRAMMRAAVSAPPPATKPTTSVSVFCGSSCAVVRPAASQRAKNESAVFIGCFLRLSGQAPAASVAEFPVGRERPVGPGPKRYDDRIALQEIKP